MYLQQIQIVGYIIYTLLFGNNEYTNNHQIRQLISFGACLGHTNFKSLEIQASTGPLPINTRVKSQIVTIQFCIKKILVNLDVSIIVGVGMKTL